MSAAHRERRACVSLPAAPGQDFPGTSLASIPGARLRGHVECGWADGKNGTGGDGSAA